MPLIDRTTSLSLPIPSQLGMDLFRELSCILSVLLIPINFLSGLFNPHYSQGKSRVDSEFKQKGNGNPAETKLSAYGVSYMTTTEFISDFWEFLKIRKKYLFMPIILILLFMGVMIIMNEGTGVSFLIS